MTALTNAVAKSCSDTPGADVIHNVIVVLLVTGERESVEDLRGRAEVQRVVTRDVSVLFKVIDHLLVAFFVMHDLQERIEAAPWASGVRDGDDSVSCRLKSKMQQHPIAVALSYRLIIARCQQLRNIYHSAPLSRSPKSPTAVVWKHLSTGIEWKAHIIRCLEMHAHACHLSPREANMLYRVGTRRSPAQSKPVALRSIGPREPVNNDLMSFFSLS